MRRTYILLPALCAAALLSALATTPALATEWLIDGVKLSKIEEIRETGELRAADLETPLIGAVEISCSYILSGTIGAGAPSLGEFAALLNLAGETISSTPLSGLPLACNNVSNCTKPELWPVGLPWDTVIYEEGGAFINGYYKEAAEKQMGYEVVCHTLGITVADICEKLAMTALIQNGMSGEALSSMKETDKLECRLSETYTGDLETEGETHQAQIRLQNGKALTAS